EHFTNVGERLPRLAFDPAAHQPARDRIAPEMTGDVQRVADENTGAERQSGVRALLGTDHSAAALRLHLAPVQGDGSDSEEEWGGCDECGSHVTPLVGHSAIRSRHCDLYSSVYASGRRSVWRDRLMYRIARFSQVLLLSPLPERQRRMCRASPSGSR